ncbi:MAG: MoxR family ATPase [Microthrixaceae bacterium]
MSTEPVSPQQVAGGLRSAVNTTMRGKTAVVDLAITALLAGGHLLVQDLPGTGKTLLAKSMAKAIGGRFGRIQCTPDLLPSDVTGTSVYRPESGDWDFRAGPIFSNVVLIDEINRASPRTQSAMLQPMEERQVSVDSQTWAMLDPFFCIATQNPFGQVGTFPLPESQLDRFAMVISVGLPDRTAEREIITGAGGVDVLDSVTAVADTEMIRAAIAATARTHADDKIVEYVLDLVAATRAETHLSQGASPRASVSLMHLARAHAVVDERDYVTPDDVQAVLVPALSHRVMVAGRVDTSAASEVLTWLMTQVSVPTA